MKAKYLLTIPIEADVENELHESILDHILSDATYAASRAARDLGAKVGSPCRHAPASPREDVDDEAYARRRLTEEAALRLLEASAAIPVRPGDGNKTLNPAAYATMWREARAFVKAGEETP